MKFESKLPEPVADETCVSAGKQLRVFRDPLEAEQQSKALTFILSRHRANNSKSYPQPPCKKTTRAASSRAIA